MPTPNREEIFKTVQQILIDALSIEEDEVTEEAILTSDLGAESIDFLDIIFRMEKAFEIKIPQEELIPRDILSNADYVDNRRLNEAGLKALKENMPYADLGAFEKDPDIDKISDVFTVGTIINFVQAKLDAQG